MKIAQVTHNYLPHIGGVEFYVKRLVDSLDKAGIDSDVLTTDMATSVNGRKPEAKYFRTTFEFMRNPISLDLVRHLRKNNFDILHLHSVWFLPCLTAVYFRKKARIISTIHGVYPDNASLTLRFFLHFYKYFVKYILNRSEKILVYSEIEKEKLQKIFKVPPDKIVIVPMAINIEQYEEEEKEQVILFTGRIIPDKNPDLLIRAIARLDNRFKKYKLVFVGSVEDQYKKELIELSNKLAVVNEIIFVGQLDPSLVHEKNELMNYYKKAALFISLGSWEGQPTRLMEAMQFKTPVIAFAAGGTADFVADHSNGCVIRELNEGLLAEKMEMILSDDRLARDLGNEARKTIIEGYNWDKIFQEIFKVYQG